MSISCAEAALTRNYEFSQGSDYALPEYPFVEPAEIRSGAVSHHPIVIVGGGLAGLTLACALACYRVPAVLLDASSSVWRATWSNASRSWATSSCAGATASPRFDRTMIARR